MYLDAMSILDLPPNLDLSSLASSSERVHLRSILVNMGLPTDVLKAWEACDRTDTLFVLVCSVFCMSTERLMLTLSQSRT